MFLQHEPGSLLLSAMDTVQKRPQMSGFTINQVNRWIPDVHETPKNEVAVQDYVTGSFGSG